MIALAKAEVEKIGIIDASDVLDATVIRMPKTYPAYFGTYDRFDEIREYINGFENLFLVGRNGMHKYNNQDHSMLTAMTAVDNIVAGDHGQEQHLGLSTPSRSTTKRRTSSFSSGIKARVPGRLPGDYGRVGRGLA